MPTYPSERCLGFPFRILALFLQQVVSSWSFQAAFVDTTGQDIDRNLVEKMIVSRPLCSRESYSAAQGAGIMMEREM